MSEHEAEHPSAHGEAPGIAPDRFEGAQLAAALEEAIRREYGRAEAWGQRERIVFKAKLLWASVLPKLLDLAAQQLPKLLERFGADEDGAARELAGTMRIELDRAARSGRNPF